MAGLEIFDSEYAFEQPESRGLTGDASAFQYIFKVYKEQVNELIPDNGMLDPNGHGYHDKSRVLVTNGAVFSTITLTFVSDVDSASGSLANRKELVPEWSRTSGLINIPLSKVVGYRMNWEYDLYQAGVNTSTITPATPGFWSTATDIEDTLNFSDTGTNYRWTTAQPSNFQYNNKTYTWLRIKKRTKPGIEVKEISTFIVIASIPYKKKADAIARGNLTPDVLKEPAEIFKMNPTGKTYWKFNPTNGPYQDGGWWMIDEQYKYNPNGWDEDIY
jgi:hypothetical protein